MQPALWKLKCEPGAHLGAWARPGTSEALRHDIFSGENFQVLEQYKLCTFLKVNIFLEIEQIILFFFFFFNIYIVNHGEWGLAH